MNRLKVASRAKRRIAVCDCETDPFKIHRMPKPFLWGYYDGIDYHEFSTTDEFVSHLSGQSVICYAHNGGKFDWHFLLAYADAYDEISLINGRIAKMRFGAAEARDSYNILPVPLAAYKKEEIDYSIMEESERDKPANKKQISEYLKSDCVYLYELVTGFIDQYGMNLTQAGAAMKQWSKMSPLPVPQTTGEFYETFAPYYYGGRVECFRAGIVDCRFSVFDMRSAYPHAMLHPHPYSDNYSHVEGFAKGADFYKVRCISRGAFPYRGEGDGNDPDRFAGLSFPADDQLRTYTVTGWEYAAALETKTILEVVVLESITFCGHVDFAEYINHFYAKRLECKAAGDEAGSLFAKLLMNSLYGKFAANPLNYKNYMIVPMDVIAGLGTGGAEGWEFCGEFGPWGLAQSDLQEERQRYYNVATGASITGFVRARLWRAIHSSRKENEGVIYCDTDSIAVACAGKEILLGEALGEWGHEGDFDRAGIAGKKLYIMRGADGWWVDENGKTVCAKECPPGGKRLYKTASKGVRLTNAQLWRAAKGEVITHTSIAPTFSPKRSTTEILSKSLKQRSDKRNTAKHFTTRRVRLTA